MIFEKWSYFSRNQFYFIIPILVLLMGCHSPQVSDHLGASGGDGGGDFENDNPEEDLFIEDYLKICSALSFKDMKVPKEIEIDDLNAFALGLNITSSFEGNEQWRNISNNFDGMGLSLGLLNQTLGTGSLQPLLLEMVVMHLPDAKGVLGGGNLEKLVAMLEDWKKTRGMDTLKNNDLFYENGHILSPLDQVTKVMKIRSETEIKAKEDDKKLTSRFDGNDALDGFFGLERKDETLQSNYNENSEGKDGDLFPMGIAEKKSIKWAIENIYKDSKGLTFKEDWKKGLQSLADIATYRSIQFEAARFIHQKSLSYYEHFKFKEIRSYLFFFDIVVQNGGLYQANYDDYKKFLDQNPNATEEERLNAILKSRLQQVKEQYRDDVKARKTAIILGRGVVHGVNRNFEKQYCFDKKSSY